MTHRFLSLLMLCAIPLLFSCGTKKKLQAAEAENQQLTSKNADLTSQVSNLEKQVADLGKQVSDLKNGNKKMAADFNQYKSDCDATKRKYEALRAALDEQYNTMQEVEKRIENALQNFANNGVDVYFKNGLVYVHLQDKLLYGSGSSTLGKNGKEALASLATVVNQYPNLKVIVVGNTDDKKFKSGNGDNWSLSTDRANSVVRVLRDDYKVDPVRLTAAGKGKYNPVADNSTEEGRAKNRRTDIILNPDFDKIWESAQNK